MTQETTMELSTPSIAITKPPSDKATALMQRAKDLETAFLAEMLSHAGLEPNSDSAFGGGIGEEQFASFLRQEQARMMVDRGGFGLAEALFRAMGGVDAAK
jgi:Rod binding domain-containing protein